MSVTDRLAALAPEQRALFEKLWEKQRKAARTHQPPSITRATGPTGEGDWPLSLDQERFWFLEQLHPGGAGLNITAAARMRGRLSVSAVGAALDEIVRRHAAWRTTFPVVEAGPVQRVAPARRQPLGMINLSGLPEERREPEALRLVDVATAAPFDLGSGPLVRAGLVRIGAEDHLCLLPVHHLVTDWMSFQIAWGELAAIYEGFAAGGPAGAAALPEPPVHYPDFAIWQREWLQGKVLDDLVSWWREQLSGVPLALELPTDRPRPAVMRMRGGRRLLKLSRELSESLRTVARREGATLFMTVLAAKAALLHRVSGQEKLILGANNANRNRPELVPVLGCFLTQVPFPIDLSGDPTFRELLARVRQSALGAYAHQDLPFGKLAEGLQPERDASRQPIVQALVQVLDGQYSELSLAGVTFEMVDAYDGKARYDLMLTLFDYPDGLKGSLEYDADLFDDTTVERWVELLFLQARTATADPDVRLSRLPALSEAARHQALVEWNDTAHPAADWTVPGRFAEQAALAPGATALAFGGGSVSFGELDRRSAALASRLRGLGIGPEERVVLVLERSPDLVAALLAVWRAGGACVPLDPASPPDRLAALLADAEPAMVLHAEPLPVQGRWRSLDPAAEGGWDGGGAELVPVSPSDLAYLIYTSGTTGMPKAVMVEHGGLAGTLESLIGGFGFGPDDRMPHLARFSFDIALYELLAPLLAGGTCELLTAEEVLEPELLLDAVERASRVHAVPSLMRQIADGARARGGERFAGLRTLFTGGDLVPPELVTKLLEVFPSADVAVLYGPTEATIVCTSWFVPRQAVPSRTLIGRPLDNVEVRVADGRGEPVPPGVPGELWVAGPGVARGYFRREELTAERFIETSGRRFYRTGDLVRQLPGHGGLLEFLGRIDNQVKIRGFRIELGEIEAVLAGHSAVREAAVVVAGAGEARRLVAYYSCHDEAADAAELRRFLHQRLPDHLVPSAFMILPELPLTTHGKVDRKTLAALRPEHVAETIGAEPRTPTQELLAGIFAEALQVERIGVQESFFEKGGHSLLATRVISRVRNAFGVELPLRELFEAPTVAELAERIQQATRSAEGNTLPPIEPVPREGGLPLSFAQERLWFLDQLEPGSSAYNLPIAMRVHGAIDAAVMESALGETMRRHEALRTTFAQEGRPVQVIAAPAPSHLSIVDLRGLPVSRRSPEALRWIQEESRRSFDLVRGPLLRSLLVRLEQEEHLLLLNMHHIVSDGWSLGVLVRELTSLYGSFLSGKAAPVAELPIQYADFAAWQRRWLQGDVLEVELSYWRERLSGVPTMLELPTDRPRPAVQTFAGASLAFVLPHGLSVRLQALSRRLGGTLFMTLLSAFQELLGRYSGQRDLAIGTPVAGRTHLQTEDLIGFFVNMLVVRTDVSGSPSFASLLGQVRETLLSAYAHQDVPFEVLVDELRPERSLSHSPLFQVVLALQNLPVQALDIEGLSFEPVPMETGTAKFDLTVGVQETGNGLSGLAEYNTDLFDRATVQRLVRHWEVLLAGVAFAPERRLSELEWVTLEERTQILQEWNDTFKLRVPRPMVHELFARHAALHPEATAVASSEGRLSYGEVECQANRLAWHLRGLGIGPETLVAVCMERTLLRVVGIVAVLKAGGAYVSLDPAYPEGRLAFMLEDARAPVVLTEARFADRLPRSPSSAQVLCLDADWDSIQGEEATAPDSEMRPEHLAYVIYTSGSTGQPKGVEIPHAGLMNLVRWHQDLYAVRPGDRGTQIASPAFDASVSELWPYLAAGASVHIPGEEARLSPPGMIRWLSEQGITLAHLMTPLAEGVLEEGIPADPELRLRALITGGDRLHRGPDPEAGFRLMNHYGPAEHAVVSTVTEVPPRGRRTGLPPIGRPIDNTLIYILDSGLRPVPAGVPGELCVAGAGLARGYHERPDLTAEKFVPDPFSEEPGGRMYRTADRVRWLPDGEIDFRGRLDHQVKIRGVRIELGEIETVLGRHAGLRDVAVTMREDRPGDKRLVAYVVASGEPCPRAGELRSFLAERLPGQMVPAAFVALDTLPLTPNGKVDRRALPPPDGSAAVSSTAPRTMPEEVLAGIFADVLGLEQVGVEDDFFTLGGHSLMATRLVSRLREAFGCELPLRLVFESPTVAALAEKVASLRDGPSAPPIRPVPRTGDLPLSFAQQRLWFLDRLTPDNPFYNIYGAVRLAGALDIAALRQAFQEIVRRHESLRTTFPIMDGHPMQSIAAAPCREIPLINLEALVTSAPEEGWRAELARLSGEESQRPFDLARGPLFRAYLVRLAAREHTLLVNLHHIVSDGWSMSILFRELATLYGAYAEGTPSPLPELPIQYADFAVWQREWLQGEKLSAELDYWRQELAGIPEALELPLDHPRPAVESFLGAVQTFALPAALVQALTSLTRRQGATPSMTMLAGFQALLARYSGREDLPVGVAIANRTHREIEGLIGFFVNTLVVRGDLSGFPGFDRLLARVRETALGAYAHQDLPFERLVEELQPERDLSRNPLIQVMVGYQNFPRAEVEVRGLVLSSSEEGTVAGRTAKFDLTLFLFEDGDRLLGSLEYNRELFEATTIQRLLGHFKNLLAAAVSQPDTPIGLLPLLDEAQRHQLALDWNDAGSVYPFEASLQELFEVQARSIPDALAVLCGEREVSYGELNRRANRLAHRLRRLGVGAESRVGLCLERSLEMVVGVLGIVKAGAAYVPLDPDYPGERLAFMVEDSGLGCLVGETQALAKLPDSLLAGMDLVLLDDLSWNSDLSFQDPRVTTGGVSLAYVIYTSGSTGRPKGVAVPHRAIVRLVRETNYVLFGPGDRMGQAANISFDAATWEVWGPLLNGGALVVIPQETVLSSFNLAATLRQKKVTSLFLTTALFNKMAREAPEAFQGLRDLLFGGEAVDPAAVRTVLANGPQRLLHVYGPTESTTYASWHPVHEVPAGATTVPIGLPLGNTSLHVLDRWQSPVPPGAAGELCIGGDGLAWGYWNRPELTAERFVPHPWKTGGRLYRTGDLVRNRADGAVEFLGRIDDQVKIRGFRIEPGEIETRLGEHPAVLQSVVLAREDVPGDRRLVAYVVQDPTYTVPESEVQSEQVSQWSEIFDDIYRAEATESDPTFNVIGWDSSYTGQPLPRNEMEEWLEDTIGRIRSLAPARVLEIGCGTGMILFRLAPGCELYAGTDISARALGYTGSQLDRLGIARSRVRLLQRPAERFDGMEADSFDTVILNSVVQYFPSADYLAEVITGAVDVVRPGGSIFLGDLRSLPLLETFHASLELFEAEPGMPLPVLCRKVQARRQLENELVVDPAFFVALQRRLPQIGRVEVYPKRGRAHNELTGFRYQVVLRIGEREEPQEIPWRDWRAEDLTLESLRRLLKENRPEVLGLRNVPNLRTAEAAAAARRLQEVESGTVEDLRHQAEEASNGAVEPQDFWDLSLEVPYRVELSWASPGPGGGFDAVLQRSDCAGEILALLPTPQIAAADRPLSHYTNNPMQGRFARRIAPELSAFLSERLPEYMVPSAFVLLEALPLSPNGKVDRRFLPDPEFGRLEAGRALVAPSNATEERLVEIWRELLAIDRIGVDDDFFELGGHSLLATQAVSRVREAFGVEMPLRTFFEAPTVAALAAEVEALLRAGGEAEVPPIVPVSRDGLLPLSFAQERLWFLQRLNLRPLAYNESAAFILDGDLDVGSFRWSLDEMLRRHESLRTSFPEVEGQAVHTILPTTPFEIPMVDLREIAPALHGAEVRTLALGQVLRPFDLGRGPLVRGLLMRLQEREHAVLFSFHHIVFDGWSTGIFVRELSALYSARIAGAPSPLPPLPIQYADFASWQRRWLQGEVLERQLAYWREQLAGVPVLGLVTDRPRPVRTEAPSGQRFALVPPGLTQKLRDFGRARGTTPFMTLLAAFQALLHRYTGQEDIAVGSAIANRDRGEVENLIGFFVNMLVMRTDLTGDPSFEDLVRRVRHVALGAYSHQSLPFEKLVEELRPDRDLRHTPLFQVSFQLLNVPASSLDLPGLSPRPLEFLARSAKFDFDLALTEGEEQLSGLLDYNADIFDGSSMERLLAHLNRLLESALENPGQRLSDLMLLSSAEHSQLLLEWNDTRAVFPSEVRLHELFEAQVLCAPDAVALSFEGQDLLYGELNERANRLAHLLRLWGAGPGVRVALCLERSLEMVVALLGVLKAGGAYVPLDPSYPRDRLTFMLTDADVPVLLTQERLLARLQPEHEAISADAPAPRVLCLDTQWDSVAGQSAQNPLPWGSADDLAYVIYTSGSTGRPKGAMNSHRAICNRLLWGHEALGLTPEDRVLQKTPFSFDVSVWELFWPLTTGARLVLARPGGHQDPDYLVRLIAHARITTLHFVPSMLQVFLEAQDVEACGSLRRVICSGEALSAQLESRFFTRFEKGAAPELYNLYGPTEAAVEVTAWRCEQENPRAAVPIGRPIANTSALILDAHLEPVPIGIPGELFLGGVQLAQGYLDRPDLTAEKFVPDPFSPRGEGARLYRTGDLVRRLPEGDIVYLGRLDHQVKVRGFRIELGEIEAALSSLAGVREAVAVVREDLPGDRKLVAYVTGEAADEELRRQLRERLPEFMVPAAFVHLTALPLNPSGKVDRKALPAPDRGPATGYVAPRNPVEEILAEIWQEVLGVERVGIQDNFFERGGHSLLAVLLMARIGKRFGQTLSLATLFTAPTLESLAVLLGQAGGSSRRSPLVAIKPQGERAPLFCVHPAGGNVLCYLDLSRHLAPEQPFYALQTPDPGEGQARPASIEAMAALYLRELRRIQPEGPYRLGGWSMGGLIAFEMARQLESEGQELDLLALIDTLPPGAGPGLSSLTDDEMVAWFAQDLIRLLGHEVGPLTEEVRQLPAGEWLDHLARLAHQASLLPEDFGSAQIRQLFETFAVNLRASRSFVPQTCFGKVSLYLSEQTCSVHGPEIIEGWRRLAPGGVEAKTLPGDHYSLLRRPHVKLLSRELMVHLAAPAKHAVSSGGTGQKDRPSSPWQPA